MAAAADARSLVADAAAFAVRASSTLRGAARAHGPALMFDGRSDTCWNSDAAAVAGGADAGQWLELAFRRPVRVARVRLTFQGGFVGQGGAVAVRRGAGGAWRAVLAFEPDDTNAPQAFELPPCGGGGGDSGDSGGDGGGAVTGLRLSFARSTDFFGRVVVYALDVEGWVVGDDG